MRAQTSENMPVIQPERNSMAQMRALQSNSLQVQVKSIVVMLAGVTADAIRHPRRGPPDVLFARQLTMYLMHHSGGQTRTAIANRYGRDRRTVSYALGAVERRREADDQFDLSLATIERAVRLVAARDAGPPAID